MYTYKCIYKYFLYIYTYICKCVYINYTVGVNADIRICFVKNHLTWKMSGFTTVR